LSLTGVARVRHGSSSSEARNGLAEGHAEHEPPFWAATADAVLASLQSSALGLTEAEAAERRRRFGLNRPGPETKFSTWRLLARQFASPLVLMLIAAAVVSWVVRERTESLIILAIVAASSALGFWQEQSASTAVRALLRLVAVRATVRRDARDHELPVEELVPGDVIRLSAGSIVPADLRLLEAE
jgi:Mg2+-importing ATPase